MFKSIMELTAKICVMPLTELEFYKKDYIQELSIIEDISEYKKKLKDSLLTGIYPLLIKTNKVYNLDQINLLFNKFFSRKNIINNSDNIINLYLNHLSKLSKAFITSRRGKLAFKYWKTDGEEDFLGPYCDINKVALWNLLNRIFTTDILVILYLLDNGYEDERYLHDYYSSVMLEDIQLEEILKRGVAETHIHRGAAISFYISWQNCMNLNGKKVTSFKIELFDNTIIKRGITITNILSIAICRLVMAKYLSKSESTNYNKFSDFLIQTDVKCIIRSINEGKEFSYKDEELIDIWDNLISEYALVTSIENKEKGNIDILEKVFGKQYSNIKTPMENIFLFKCIQYIRKNNVDVLFSKVFIQYIRIKNEVFQVKVQNNQIKGLINFKPYSKRSTTLVNSQLEYTDKTYWELLILNQLQNKHLKKLELRAMIPFKESSIDLKRNIKKIVSSFLKAYIKIIEKYYIDVNENKCSLIGLVFSMAKKSDDTEPEKCWQNFYKDEFEELHFIKQRSRYEKQLHVLKDIRQSIKGLSNYIVGVDAASVENNTEPWVFAPIYEKFRDSKCDKHLYLKDDEIIVQRGLGFTFHVGEDFRHLITGLRRIDEVIENFKFHAGDRIGHGIALGIDAYKWAENNKITILPRMEYLENLLWIWGIYKDGKYDNFFDIAYLEQKILQQAEYIYKVLDGITVYNLWKAYKNKFKEFDNRNINDEFRSKSGKKFSEISNNFISNKVLCFYTPKQYGQYWNEEKLTYAQHCKCYLERMIEPFQVLIKKEEIKMINEVQKLICRKVSRKGIIVETNPTSNTAIGEIESIFQHYIHSLNKRGLIENIDPESSIIVSINSDDPSIFNTNVSNEFAYIFYSLQEKGYSREDILLWIDKVRRYGMDFSFIEDRHMQPKEIVKEIRQILDELDPNLW